MSKKACHSELVSESQNIEAPYELPEEWKWERLGNYITLLRGVSYKKDDAHSEKLENDCLIMRGGNIVEGSINLETDNVYVDKSLVSENQLIKKYDIIIVTSTGSTKVIGRAGVSKDNYNDVAFGAFLTLARPNDLVNKSYINHYFQSSLYRERIRQLASGVNINNIRSEYITETPIPLPPTLAEQQRIVNRIETMFAKLDQAREKTQTVLDSFETRKAAILHQAFTGNLTAKWRKENGVSDDSWEEKSIGNCGSVFGGGTPSTSHKEYWKNGNIPWITSKDMKFDLIEDSELHVNMNGIDNSSAKYIDKPAVLFVMRSGILRRTFPVCMVKKEFTVNQDLKALVPNDSVILEYLFYACKANERKILDTCMKSGTTVESINSDSLFNFLIKIPSLTEQQEIVHILDIILEKERTAKSAAEQVLEQIDLLKKSILARAFKGEL